MTTIRPEQSEQGWPHARSAERKGHTRRGDEMAQQRHVAAMVRIDKTYLFETYQGSASLDRLCFGGRSQLIVYHFMSRAPNTRRGVPSARRSPRVRKLGLHLENRTSRFRRVAGPLASCSL